MRDVVIKTGVYGRRDEKGRVLPVAKGERVTLSDEEAARLVALDVAVYAGAPTEAPRAPPVAPPGGDEPEGGPQDTPGADTPTEAATEPPAEDEGDTTDSAEVKRLERMPKDDLVQMAQDMGVDISGAKNNHERAVLIVAAGSQNDGEAPPDLGAGDIVQ